jgi:hypothetical protein
VRCPNCETGGKREVLGEVDENGNFVVMRFHKGTTIIKGDNLKVICGVCGEEVYRKEANNGKDSNIRVAWMVSESFVQPFGSI